MSSTAELLEFIRDIQNRHYETNDYCMLDEIAERLLQLDAMQNPHPLTIEQLRERANKPYWHRTLNLKGREDHWVILDEHVAKHPEDYHYGERWIAYDHEVTEDTK